MTFGKVQNKQKNHIRKDTFRKADPNLTEETKKDSLVHKKFVDASFHRSKSSDTSQYKESITSK